VIQHGGCGEGAVKQVSAPRHGARQPVTRVGERRLVRRRRRRRRHSRAIRDVTSAFTTVTHADRAAPVGPLITSSSSSSSSSPALADRGSSHADIFHSTDCGILLLPVHVAWTGLANSQVRDRPGSNQNQPTGLPQPQHFRPLLFHHSRRESACPQCFIQLDHRRAGWEGVAITPRNFPNCKQQTS